MLKGTVSIRGIHAPDGQQGGIMKRLLLFSAALLAFSCGDDTSGPTGGQDWAVYSVWGSKGPAEGQFGDILQFAVAPVTGDVYLADRDNDRVQYLSDNGTYLGSWDFGSDGWSIAVSQNGIVFVGSHEDCQILMYNLAGVFLGGWGGPGSGEGQFEELAWLRCLPGAAVGTVDLSADQVQLYDETGALAAEWTVPGLEYGEYPGIDNIAVNSSGNVLVFSEGVSAIWEYTMSGTLVGEHYMASDVDCIAAGEDGRVYLGCADEPRVRILDSQWEEVDSITLTGLVPGDAGYHPLLLEAGDEGRIFVYCQYGSDDLRMVVLAPE